MHMKYLKSGMIIAKGRIKKNNQYIRIEKIFNSEEEFWNYLMQ